MKINHPNIKGIDKKSKLGRRLLQFNKLLEELAKHELSDDLIAEINQHVKHLEKSGKDQKTLSKTLPKSQHLVVQAAMKKHNLVPQNYHRNLWLPVGMASFGLPIGVAMGFFFDNMAFIGIGLPIGLVIGMAVGIAKDKKAKEEGRQLNIEIGV